MGTYWRASQKAVFVYFTSKQILPFGFAKQHRFPVTNLKSHFVTYIYIRVRVPIIMLAFIDQPAI